VGLHSLPSKSFFNVLSVRCAFEKLVHLNFDIDIVFGGGLHRERLGVGGLGMNFIPQTTYSKPVPSIPVLGFDYTLLQ